MYLSCTPVSVVSYNMMDSTHRRYEVELLYAKLGNLIFNNVIHSNSSTSKSLLRTLETTMRTSILL